MISVGLHCRLVGRPGRLAALERFIDHVLEHDQVWVTRRIDIARHWHAHHQPQVTNNGGRAFTIRTMRTQEIALAADWAAAEGWNPGLNVAACFATVDAAAF